MPSLTIGRCDAPGCGAAIVFVTVSNRAGRPPGPMPLDASPDPAGNVAVHQDDKLVWRGRVLGKDSGPAPYETLYCPHFATCRNPGGHRKQRRNAAKRNRPAHRASAQPGMF